MVEYFACKADYKGIVELRIVMIAFLMYIRRIWCYRMTNRDVPYEGIRIIRKQRQQTPT
jgi:hypothetical protein